MVMGPFYRGPNVLPRSPGGPLECYDEREHDPSFPAPVGDWRGRGLLVLARPGHPVGDGAGCAPGFSSRSQLLLRSGSGALARETREASAGWGCRGADRGCRASLLRGFAGVEIVPLVLAVMDSGARGRSGLLVRRISAPHG